MSWFLLGMAESPESPTLYLSPRRWWWGTSVVGVFFCLFTLSISCEEPWITFQWLFDRKQGESSVCCVGSCNFALKKCFVQTGNVCICFCHRTNKTLIFSQLLKRNDQYWSLLEDDDRKKELFFFFCRHSLTTKKNTFTFLASMKNCSFWKAYCRNKYFGKLQVWNSLAFLSAFEKNKSLFNSFNFFFGGGRRFTISICFGSGSMFSHTIELKQTRGVIPLLPD